MKTIVTRQFNSRIGSERVRATDGDSSITVSLDGDVSRDAAHAKAAVALARKKGWTGTLLLGHVKNPDERVFVFSTSAKFKI